VLCAAKKPLKPAHLAHAVACSTGSGVPASNTPCLNTHHVAAAYDHSICWPQHTW
jgi:hypothetical protein